MSPYELEVCLWYYARACDWENMDSPFWERVRERFLKEELLKPSSKENRMYEKTERLDAFVIGLCALPLPKKVWEIPQYKVSVNE